MISLYLPGTSPIHRAPAWLKLLVLALGAIVLSLLPNSWGLAAAAFLLPAIADLLRPRTGRPSRPASSSPKEPAS